MIIPTNRQDKIVDENGRASARLAEVIESLSAGVNGVADTDAAVAANTADIAAITLAPGRYEEENVTEDRAFDADSTTTAELADILGTLISDLRRAGVIS